MAADSTAAHTPSHATPHLPPQPPASFTPRPSASARRKSSPRRSRSLTAPDLAAAASRCRPRLLRLHSLTPPATTRLADGRLLAALPPPCLRALRLTALSAEQIDALAVAITAERRARLAAAAKLQRCLRGKTSAPPPASSLPAAAAYTVVHTAVVEEGGGTKGGKKVEDMELEGHVAFPEGVGGGYPSHERLGRRATAEGEEGDGLLAALAGGQSFPPSHAASLPPGAAASAAAHTAVVKEGGGAEGGEKVGLVATGEVEEEDGLLSALAGLMAFMPPPASSLPAAAAYTVVHTAVVEEGGGTKGGKKVEDMELEGHVAFPEGVGGGYPSHERLGRRATAEGEEGDGLLAALAGGQSFPPSHAASLPPGAAASTAAHTAVAEGADAERKNVAGGTTGEVEEEDGLLSALAEGKAFPPTPASMGEGEEEDGLLSALAEGKAFPPTPASMGEGEEEDGLLSALAGVNAFFQPPAASLTADAAAYTAVRTVVAGDLEGEEVEAGTTGEVEEEDGLLSALAGVKAFLPPPAASLPPGAAASTAVHKVVVEAGGDAEGENVKGGATGEGEEEDGILSALAGVKVFLPPSAATGAGEVQDGLLSALAGGQSILPPSATPLPPSAAASTAVQTAVVEGGGDAERRKVEGSPTSEVEEEDGLLSALAGVKAFLPPPAASLPPGAAASTAVHKVVVEAGGDAEGENVKGGATGEGEEEDGILSALAGVKVFLPPSAATGAGEVQDGLLSALAGGQSILPPSATSLPPSAAASTAVHTTVVEGGGDAERRKVEGSPTSEVEEEDGLLSALAGVKAFLPTPPASFTPAGATASNVVHTAVVEAGGEAEGKNVGGRATGEGEEEDGLLSALAGVKAFLPPPAATVEGEEEDDLLSALAGVNAFLQPPAASVPPDAAAYTAVHTAPVEERGDLKGVKSDGGTTGEGEEEDGLLSALAGVKAFLPPPAASPPPGAAASTAVHKAVVEAGGDAEGENVKGGATGEGEEEDGILAALAGVKAFPPSRAASLPPDASTDTVVHTAVVEVLGDADVKILEGCATGEGEEEDGLLSALAGVTAFLPPPAASLPPVAAAYVEVQTAVVEGCGDAKAENVGGCATGEGEEEDGLLSALAGVKAFQLPVSASLPPAAAYTLVDTPVVEGRAAADGKTVEGGATGEVAEEDGLLAALAGVKAFPPPPAASLPSSAAVDVSAFPSFAPPSTHIFPLLSSSSLESRASSLSMHSANRYSAASFAGGDGESSSGSPRRSRHSSIAGACELLIFVCSPSRSPLPGLQDEALRVSRAIQASIFIGGTAADLRRRLLCTPTRRFLFSGHADTGLGGARTLGFTSDHGELAAVHPPDLVDMLAAHAPCNGGELELVFLNGCHSDALGRAVHEAGIPFVVCWTTLAENSAAQLFATTFFETMAQGHSYQRSFQEAISEIKMQLRPGRLSNGQPARVPKYTLTDPEKPSGAPRDYLPAPFAAGIPTIYYPLNRMPSSADCEHSPPSAAADDGECETQPFDGAEANCLHLPDGSVAARLPAEGGADILALGYEAQPPRRAEPGREAPLVVETLLLRDAERKKKPWVSRLHAEVRRRGAELVLTAVGKSFSFVNEVPLHASSSKHPREVRLYHGDQLRFGGDLSESECGDYRKFIYFVNRPSLGKRPS